MAQLVKVPKMLKELVALDNRIARLEEELGKARDWRDMLKELCKKEENIEVARWNCDFARKEFEDWERAIVAEGKDKDDE